MTVRSDASTGAAGKFDYAQTVHSFAKLGHYLVRVEHTTGTGATITARLHVEVDGEATPKADGAKPEADAFSVSDLNSSFECLNIEP